MYDGVELTSGGGETQPDVDFDTRIMGILVLMTEFFEGCVSICEAKVTAKTEATLAQAMRQRGIRTTLAKGRYWMHVGGLFWQPVHWLARLPATAVGRPHPLCLGYVCTIRAEDESFATGRMPLHVLGGADLESYDIATLPAKRRNQLRKAWKLVTVVAIVDPTPYIQRLHEVTCDAVARFKGGKLPELNRFASGLVRRLRDDRDLLVAGFVEGTLAGYFLVSCVEDVAYIDQVMLDTKYLSSDIGTGLTYETVMVLKRHGGIKHVVYGRHTPEQPQLCNFKEGMGFKVVAWPVRSWLMPPLRYYLAHWEPSKLYRITGSWPSSINNHGQPEEPEGSKGRH